MKNLGFNYIKRIKNGFTFLEFVVVMFVVAVGLAGVYGVVPMLFNQTAYINSRIAASYLAQEGVEIVKSIRDYNLINASTVPAWNTGLDTTGDYCVDYSSNSLTSCSGSPLLKSDGGFYNYSAGNPTKFTRIIRLEVQADMIKIISKVQWSERGKTSEIKAEEHMYDYY